MRRRIILYIVGGLLALCVIIGILAPKTNTPQAAPTEPAQRVATIALATEPPAPTRTQPPTSSPAPTRTRRPTAEPSSTPTHTAIPPTQVPPTTAPPTAVPATAAPAASCPGGCTEQKPGCDIKGNVNSDGERIYHMPGMRDYKKVTPKPGEGDRWFCTEAEAQAADFRRAGQ